MAEDSIELKNEDFKIDFNKIKDVTSVEVKDGKMVINIKTE